jgi:exodeoxyribonuclease V alpha subunit
MTPTATLDAARHPVPDLDPHDVALVDDCPDPLRPFNEAGVLHPADVHTAVALCRLTRTDDPTVLLAIALAVRGPRVGHVCVDLATVHETVTDADDDAEAVRSLPWPTDLAAWVAAVAGARGLVSTIEVGCDPGPPEASVPCPLTLDGSRLYLDRYWQYEGGIASQLGDRAREQVDGIDAGVLRRGLDELFGPAGGSGAGGAGGAGGRGGAGAAPAEGPNLQLFPTESATREPDLQRLAAATAVTRRLAVIAGGPGTGKTTTIARVLALLDAQAAAAGQPSPRVALVAPTGKAAARLEESLREALERDEFSEEVRGRLATAEASTIHRLLRQQPGNSSRFRHHAGDPLPHDVVIVDEASMVSLALMAKLLDALPAHTRLVLVGDPQQLRSVEAGAVLGDIVGPSLQGLRLSADARARLTSLTGEDLDGVGEVAPTAGIGDGIVVLQRVHRFDERSGIADLATAIQAGEPDGVVEVLRAGYDDVVWLERDRDARDESDTGLAGLRDEVRSLGRRVRAAAEAGDAETALAAIEEVRILCAHRRGPFGVSTWVPRVEEWIGDRRSVRAGAWLVGRPVLMTRNDHQLRIYNGDVGVVVATDDGPRVAFPTPEGPRLISPSRLDATETVHAMTIHKSQGSQFRHAVVVLPTEDSRILSRELFYTGVTRAQRQVTVIGSEAAVRAAVERVVRRASGLRERLWEPSRIHP